MHKNNNKLGNPRLIRNGILAAILLFAMMFSQWQLVAQALPDTTEAAGAESASQATEEASQDEGPGDALPPEESDTAGTLAITGQILYMGQLPSGYESAGPVLYANGQATGFVADVEARPEGGCFYHFSGVPAQDESGQAYSYTVRGESCGGLMLFYRQDGALLADEGAGAAAGADLVYVELGALSGVYRVEKEEEDPLPGELSVALSTKNAEDAACVPAVETPALKPGDTQWTIEGLPVYNPLNGNRVEYRVTAGGAAAGYEIRYENAAPYEADADAAYANGAVVALYVGEEEAEGFAGLMALNSIYTAEGAATFEAEINWNDNSDEQNRPNPVLQLYYKAPGAGVDGYTPLTAELLESWGVTGVDLTTPIPDKDAYNSWKYRYENLPAALSDGQEQHAVTYTFAFDNTTEIEANYFIAKTSDTKAMLTKKTTVSFDKIWKDSSDRYHTRPSVEVLKSRLVLSRTVEGATTQLGALSALANVAIGGEGGSAWHFEISQLPMYDELGHPCQYSVVETGNALALAAGSDFAADGTVKYTARYENVGNYADRADLCYSGGTITNSLTDTVHYAATKKWQDDGTQTRPTGNLYLYRYPNLPGMSYATASPVTGMQLALDNTQNAYTIDFSALAGFPAGGLPRFDAEGNEYIYFVQEILTGNTAGNYTRFYDYGGSTPPDTRNINALFNGGTLQNRRTGTVDIPVTKTWKAAAQQDMNATVDILVERRQKGTSAPFVPVEEGVGPGGIFTMAGFRAEEMERTHVLAGLPRFNEEGLEYEYRVTEYAITMGETRVLVDGEYCTIGRVTYQLSQTKAQDGSVNLVNRLVGDTVVRIRKIWNGRKAPDDWTTVGFTLYRDGVPVDPGGTTITMGGQVQSDLSIKVEDAWQRETPGGVDSHEGEWLVISGLPRYDAQGREYKYTVSETGVSGYHATYSTTRDEGEKDGQVVGMVDATVTNTPAGEGTHIEVVKEWLDDGDENCRAPVMMDLYHMEGNEYRLVSSATLNVGNDWLAWMALPTEDQNPANYYVKERSVGGDYAVNYGSEPFPLLSTSYTKVGQVTTNAHFYDVFAMRNTDGTRYAFQNRRTGTVNIELQKTWTDNQYQENTRHQAVTLEVRQWLNYSEQTSAIVHDTIVLDGVTDSVETVPWQAAVSGLPKYNEKGVLFHYTVVETQVEDLTNNQIHPVTNGGYTLDDTERHHYAVTVKDERQYGEHSGGSAPTADNYTFTVDNARRDTVNFEVYKLWKDVVRTAAAVVDLTPAQAAMEVKTRPHIYLTLYQRIEGAAEYTEVPGYVERVWTTTGEFNEYYWKCSFDPLPRYTADGKEITYAVEEKVVAPGEYYAKYYAGAPIPVTGNTASALAKVTDVPIYDVSGSPLWSSGGTWANPGQAFVPNGGTIVNGRTGVRTLSGQKIWLNVPTNIAAANFPTVTLKLHIYKYNNSDQKYEYVDEGNLEVELDSGVKNFTFGNGSQTLPRYDEFGTIIRYQAKEMGMLTPGYATPVYDDYNLTVTNEYKLTGLTSEEQVSVSVTKTWDLALAPGIPAALYPTANITLWRQLTSDSAGLTPIEGTEENTGQSVQIQYPNSVSGTNPVFTNLPRYGYNGNPFRYFLKESINGYTVSGLTEDKDTLTKDFAFEVGNQYTGEGLVTLGGTKDWVDQSDRYNLRPGTLGLKVYRAVEGVDAAPEDITANVVFNWSNITSDRLSYTVGALNATVGNGGKLYGYAPNGAKYIYYVEELPTNHHYTPAVKAGTPVTGVGGAGNLVLRAEGSGDTRTASFQNSLLTVACQLQKTWLKNNGGTSAAMDASEFAMMLPASITVKVQQSADGGTTWIDYSDKNGLVTRTFNTTDFKPTAGSTRTLTITGLPKYGANTSPEMQYRAVETGIGGQALNGSGYAGGFTAVSEGGAISNTLATIPLVLKKTWDDNNNQDGVRPTSITFKIVRDGSSTQFMTVTVPADELATGRTVYVPMYRADGTTPSTYTVQEQLTATEKAFYTLRNENAPGSYTLADPGTLDGKKTYAFVNDHTKIKISLTVTKSWSDSSIGTTIGNGAGNANVSAIRPGQQKVTVGIQRSADNGESWQDMNSADLGNQPQSVQLTADTAYYTWIDLEARHNTGDGNSTMVRYQYRVVETGIPGYTATYRVGTTGSFSETPAIITDANCVSLAGAIQLQNRLDTTTLDVEKLWNHNSSPFAEEPEVKVVLLYRLAGSNSWQTATGSGSTLTLNTGGGFKGTFSGLPQENNAGTQYEYSVKEFSIGGTAADGTTPYYSYTPAVALSTVDGRAKATVTNTLETRRDITVRKVWADAGNQDGKRPAGITVALLKDMDTDYAATTSAPLNAGNGWAHIFGDLPKYRPDGEPCTYHVRESSTVTGYTVTYAVNGGGYGSNAATESAAVPDVAGAAVDVKNEYTPLVMNLAVTKTWDDQADKYGLRPAAIGLRLYASTDPGGANPTAVGGVQPLADPWTHTWNDLPIRQNATGTALAAGQSKPLYYFVVEVQADGSAVPFGGYRAPVYAYTATGPNSTATASYISGSLLDATGTTHNAQVTNSLDVVDVTVTKEWNDFNNLYHSRPVSLVFQLQKRTVGGGQPFTDMTDGAGQSMTLEMTCDTGGYSQSGTFPALPKYNADGALYEYRAVEAAYNLGAADVPVTLPDPADPATGEFGYTATGGTFQYTFTTAVGGYATTVTNELAYEKIDLSGTKTWLDEGNRFGSRPLDLQLRVYYKDNPADPAWTEYSPQNYRVDWVRDSVGGLWYYTIPGLPKYVFGTTDLIQYAVEEVTPAHYTASPQGYSWGALDFTNSLDVGAVLTVEKQKDRGPADMAFTFKVYVSPVPDAAGVLYRGAYSVFGARDDVTTASPVATGSAGSGGITINAGQKIALEGLPLGFYYTVREEPHPDYDLRDDLSTGLSGRLATTAGRAVAAVAVNHARSELAIANQTPNPGINTGNLTDAGGKVVVMQADTDVPCECGEDSYKANRVAVAWQPETYWVLGGQFTIYYTEFGSDEEKEVTVYDYLGADGTLRPLSACRSSDPAALQRFLSCGARLDWLPDGSVKLLMAGDVNDMPRKTRVCVEFLPTLAARNITEGEQGGTVMVETGTASSLSDGVPAHGGTPYNRVLTVYGNADEGYVVDVNRIMLRNLNDLDGPAATLAVRADGSFSAILATTINRAAVQVEVTGRLQIKYSGGRAVGVELVLDSHTIPLQVDFLFEKPQPEPHNDGTGNTGAEDGSGTANPGSPQTGDRANLWLYALLAAGAAAGAAAALVYRRRTLKR